MKNIMFCIGMPRSGSTLLMNILNENPEIYTSGTCPLPYVVQSVKLLSNNVAEFKAMDMDVVNESLASFLRSGVNGWFDSQTKKSNVISKNRLWDEQFRFLFKIYDNPKFILTVRDPRDIICSFEKLLQKYPHIYVGTGENPFEWHSFEKRMELYCTDITNNMGRWLYMLNHSFEYMKKYPNNFFILRWEDFCSNSLGVLNNLYQWMNLPFFDHNLNSIQPSDHYEHDPVYSSLVSHKTRSRFEPIPPQWPKYFSEEQNHLILKKLNSFYSFFYPEILNNE